MASALPRLMKAVMEDAAQAAAARTFVGFDPLFNTWLYLKATTGWRVEIKANSYF